MKNIAIGAAAAITIGFVVGHAQAPQPPFDSLRSLRALQSTAPQPQTQAPPRREPLNPAPDRRPGEGQGPFKTLVLRGAILIDGTGAPPVGPVDIVIADNRIQSVRGAGTPGLPLRSGRPPEKRTWSWT